MEGGLLALSVMGAINPVPDLVEPGIGSYLPRLLLCQLCESTALFSVDVWLLGHCP